MLVKRKLYSVMDEEGNQEYYLYDENNGEEKMFATVVNTAAGKMLGSAYKPTLNSSYSQFWKQAVSGGSAYKPRLDSSYAQFWKQNSPGLTSKNASGFGGLAEKAGASRIVRRPGKIAVGELSKAKAGFGKKIDLKAPQKKYNSNTPMLSAVNSAVPL